MYKASTIIIPDYSTFKLFSSHTVISLMWVQVLGGKGLKTVQKSPAVWVHLVCKISKITTLN